jgi:omega-hydroxy-beta-dihydromenaquinone-9 sulfotransferase
LPWQEQFNAVIGMGLFGGATLGDWLHLLRENRFVVHPRFIPRALTITGVSVLNSISRRVVRWQYGARYRSQPVREPLFILGHWRSGTTHLHNLLSHDARFGYPNLYQVICPHTFLRTEGFGSKLLSMIAPSTRAGVDNVRMGPDVPYEDEFALAAMSSVSPYTTMAFPQGQKRYDRFLTLRDASPDEIRRWKEAITEFLQKLSFKHQRPLVLKSPPHTCRIRLLLELFPDAKFVFIHRHPFDVFRSMKKLLSGGLRYWQMQDARCVDWQERTIRQFREMHEVYFEERSLIPEGRLHELSYEELDDDPVGQVRTTYESLQLPDFDVFEPTLREYVDSLSGYRKNARVELPLDLRQRLADEWGFCFDEWGYSASVGTEVAAGRAH